MSAHHVSRDGHVKPRRHTHHDEQIAPTVASLDGVVCSMEKTIRPHHQAKGSNARITHSGASVRRVVRSVRPHHEQLGFMTGRSVLHGAQCSAGVSRRGRCTSHARPRVMARAALRPSSRAAQGSTHPCRSASQVRPQFCISDRHGPASSRKN